jgi:5'(3')-deoxyribonucleotidase
MKQTKVIYLDMDGVITNFHTGVANAHKRPDLAIKASQELWPTDWWYNKELGSEDDIWKPVDKLGIKFWEELQPLPYMEEVLTAVEDSGLPWYICTRARNNPYSVGGKVSWIAEHLGGWFNDIIIMKDKSRLAHPNALLIDDSNKNVTMFQSYGGQAYLFPQPWNHSSGHIETRITGLEQAVRNFKLQAEVNVRLPQST